MSRKLLVHTTAEMKSATYSTLRLLIDQGRLLLPASAEELLRELLMLRVDLTPTGGERIEAGSGHDDCCDALMLAAGPYRDRERRWGSLLAYYADPRRRMPSAAIDRAVLGELETVRSGGGLAVPRLPVWQSVRGREVTAPPGLDLTTPRERPSAQVVAIRGALADAASNLAATKGEQ